MTSPIQVPDHLLNSRSGDMSEFVVHFTEDPEVLGRILATGCLRASGPFGFSFFRKIPQVADRHRSVCLSEIPLNQIQRLTRQHGHYGIGFAKDFIRSRRGARVWYLDEESEQARLLSDQLHLRADDTNFDDPLWELTPFVDLVMLSKRFVFDWEREWRVRGDLNFLLSDVAFVVTPEGIDEEPALEGLFSHPDLDLIVVATPQPLAEYVESLIAEFLRNFEDPICLPVDGGAYVWTVNQWSTEDAVYDLFGDLQESILDQVTDYLNSECPEWVRSEDLAQVYE